MTRNFYLTGRTGSAIAGGNQSPSPPEAPVTQRYSNVYPLPAQSLRPDPLAAATRERAALSFVTVVLSLTFLAPLILAWAMINFR